MKRQRILTSAARVIAALLAAGACMAAGADPVASEASRAAAAAPPSVRHDDCVRDEECVAMTSLQQSCRHVDPAATEVCPAVNRKYASFFANVECYTNTGCRPITDIACRAGVCTGLPAD